MTPKWIDLVEAAYDVETPSHDVWVRNLVTSLAPALNPARRAIGAMFCLEAETLHIFAASGSDPDYVSCGVAIMNDKPEYAIRCYRGKPFRAFSEHVGKARFRRWEAFSRHFGRLGERDALGIVARDGGPWGVSVVGGQPRVCSTTRRDAVPWERIAAHVHAALRLRLRLHGAPPLGDAHGKMEVRTAIDAVVSPDGKVEHAEPSAQPFVDSLKHAARAIDRARARQRREDPEGALEAWRALVEGEWSLIETFESDGRRYLLARRNPPDAPRTAVLTERERRVLGLRARAHGIKLIAYEMGVSGASVSRALGSGMHKLGIRSSAELARFVSPKSK